MSLGPGIAQAAVVGGPPSIISPGSFPAGTYTFPGPGDGTTAVVAGTMADAIGLTVGGYLVLSTTAVTAYGSTISSAAFANTGSSFPAPFNSAGNLLIQSRGNVSRAIIFATNIAGTLDWRWHFSGAGHLLPKNDTHDIGDSTTPYQVRAIYMKGAAGKGLFAEGVRVVGAQVTGWATVGWAGAVNRAAFDSATVTLPVLAQHVLAILKDIGTQGHGLIDAAGLP